MSTAAKGHSRCKRVESILWDYGYRTARITASGRRGDDRSEHLGFDCDVIAIAPEGSQWPHLIIEVGGRKKSIALSLAEMQLHPLPPGFVAVVARLVDSARKRWRWSTASDEGHDSLGDFLDAYAYGSSSHSTS